jgi:hypothetical protein
MLKVWTVLGVLDLLLLWLVSKTIKPSIASTTTSPKESASPLSMIVMVFFCGGRLCWANLPVLRLRPKPLVRLIRHPVDGRRKLLSIGGTCQCFSGPEPCVLFSSLALRLSSRRIGIHTAPIVSSFGNWHRRRNLRVREFFVWKKCGFAIRFFLLAFPLGGTIQC